MRIYCMVMNTNWLTIIFSLTECQNDGNWLEIWIEDTSSNWWMLKALTPSLAASQTAPSKKSLSTFIKKRTFIRADIHCLCCFRVFNWVPWSKTIAAKKLWRTWGISGGSEYGHDGHHDDDVDVDDDNGHDDDHHHDNHDHDVSVDD